MTKTRMEAFSDGVIAIILTIMVLGFKVPLSSDWSKLLPLVPAFLSYVLSFIFIGIYWNNHHHLLQAAKRVNGKVLWANLHLLFWLTLIPFVTLYMGANHLDSFPVALYGVVMLGSSIAYYILTKSLLHLHGRGSVIGSALGSARKERISVVLYIVAVFLAMQIPLAAIGVYIVVALMWLVPDQRIERSLED